MGVASCAPNVKKIITNPVARISQGSKPAPQPQYKTIMTTSFVKNIMIVCAMAFNAAVANAQTAETKVDTTTVDGTVLQAIFGESVDRGHWEAEIKDGVARKSRCNGVKLHAGAEVASLMWNSDLGSGSSVMVGPKISASYKHGIFEPTFSFSYLFGGKVEGQSLNMPKASLDLRFWNTSHDHKKNVRLYAFAGASYIDVKSIDLVDLGQDWELFEIPFHGHAVALGGGIGSQINVGELVKHTTVTVGKNNFFLDVIGHMAINVEVGYQHAIVNKMEHYQTKNTLGLNLLSGSITVTVDLP